MTSYYPEDFDPDTDELYRSSVVYAGEQVSTAWTELLTEAMATAALAMEDFENALRMLRKNPHVKKRCMFDD